MFSYMLIISRIFQKENVGLSLVQPCLKTTINKYKDTSVTNLGKVDEVLSTDLKDFKIVSKKKDSSPVINIFDQLHGRL